MRKEQKYKIAVWVLSLIIVILGAVLFAVTRPKKIPRPPVAAIKGEIAIVLDDWGYNLNNFGLLEQIKFPVTAAVLPNLAYSGQIAEELHALGWEIILHLPMEPREKRRLEKNTVKIAMGESAIKNIIAKDLASIVYAKGVSNHMGSGVTENKMTMEIIFKELKKRRLYFLDSFVSPKTICADLARKMGLGFLRRDIFLDNTEEPAYIRGQIYKLKLQARTKGSAIGIGHDRKVTLEVLKEVIPEMEREGYKFVYLSDLVK